MENYLIFLDTEANGLNLFQHRLIEIAFIFVAKSSNELVASYESLIQQSQDIWDQSDPKSLEMNGFTYPEVSQGIIEHDVREQIIDLFQKHQISRDNAVFICQNPSFDRSFFTQIIPSVIQERLNWPYHWLDLASMFWLHSLKKGRDPFQIGISKDKIAHHFSLPNEEMPHRAMNGVKHLKLCYDALLKAQ